MPCHQAKEADQQADPSGRLLDDHLRSHATAVG